MHDQSAFNNLGYKAGDFPVAEKLSKQVFSLPMHGYIQASI
jgi:dTDP-4-amino-4,6-dideoxygalactose transaminase